MPRDNTPDPRKAGKQPPFPKQTQDGPGAESAMSPRPDYGENDYVGHNRLAGKVAVITGGDSGIGRAVALAYAREGADVVIGYLNENEDAAETQRIVEKAGRKCISVAGDLSQESACKQLIETAVRAFDKIDILVNNAAYQGKAVESLAHLDHARVEHAFKVNIVAMFDLTRLALPAMKSGGSVINVGSIQAYKPSNSILDYAATKGAIIAFTKGLAQELVPSHGIRVNCVAPGPVWTPLIVQSFDAEKAAHFGEQSTMGRPAQPKELAPAFVFLASDDARYINGEVLGVTGGGILA